MRATEATWQQVKNDYTAGSGSMRALAACYGISPSTLTKRAVRQHWAAQRTLASSAVDTALVTTMQQKTEAFVNKSAEATETFMTRITDSEATLENEDRRGIRLLSSALKDVVAVGRDTFGLGNRDEGNRCIVNLGFLRDYVPEAVRSEQPAAVADCVHLT